MVFKNFKNFIFKELIFPKTLVIDHPGIIINKTIKRFGRGDVKTRTSYYFEDIYSNLYLDSLGKMGQDKVDLLWYKIGKDSSLRYLSFLGDAKFSDKVIYLVLEHCLNAIKSSGFSFVGSFHYNPENKSLEILGEKNVICRKTGSGSLVAGIVAGLMTYFQGENFEAEALCVRCPELCKVVSHSKIKEIYISNFIELKPMKNYSLLNFLPIDLSSKFSSFGDLVKFNKIKMVNEESKLLLKNKVILTSEIGLGELFLKNYTQSGELKLFQSSVIKSSSELFGDLTKDKNHEYKLKFASNLISGLGWGIPHFKKKGDIINLTIFNPLRTKYGVSHVGYIINGFLNKIYDKNFKINQISDQEIVFEC